MGPVNNMVEINNVDPNVQDVPKYGERRSPWHRPSSLPPSIHKLFEEYNVLSYLPMFEKQGVDVDAFLALNDEDLKSMGIDKLGPRKRVKLMIDKYRQGKPCVNADDVNMNQPCPSEMESPHSEEIERLSTQLQQAMSYIQQHEPLIHQHEQHEHQYRKQCHDMAKFVETEQQRISQILFFVKDIGKNCTEVMTQLHKIKEHHLRMGGLLNDIKNHPNSESIRAQLRIEPDLFDSTSNVQCQIEVATNCMEIAHKHVTSALDLAQVNVPQDRGILSPQS